MLTMGAFAALRGLPKMSTTALWRALFNTGPGPDAGGEKPGPSVFDHSREKSGTDAAVALLAAPAAGAVTCPKAGVAAAAVNVANKRKARCLRICPTPFSDLVPSDSSRAPIAWLMTPVPQVTP